MPPCIECIVPGPSLALVLRSILLVVLLLFFPFLLVCRLFFFELGPLYTQIFPHHPALHDIVLPICGILNGLPVRGGVFHTLLACAPVLPALSTSIALRRCHGEYQYVLL